MADKLPPDHGVDAHKDKMGKVMHEFKRGKLHSGTGVKGRKGKVVTSRQQAIAIGISESKHVEQLIAMGYSEEAALAVASFIESQKAADEVEQHSLEGDIDSRPGKQKGAQGKPKQDPQGSIATFPTVPHSEGPMVKANKRSCPTGTRAVGGGFCKNPKPGKRQYFEIEKGKSCPPGSKTAGKGRCRVDFAERGGYDGGVEAIQNSPCPEKKTEAEKQAEKAQQGTQPTQPQQPQQQQAQQPQQPAQPEDTAKREAAKQKAERCRKEQGN